MSIINDALKKTQQTRKNDKDKREQAKNAAQEKPATEKISKPQQPRTPINTQKPIPISSKKKSGPQKPPFVFTFKMASLLTVAALLAMMAITNYQRLTSPTKMHADAQPVAKTKVIFEGVMRAENNEPIAFINKQSLKMGDTVGGMKIVAITQDTIDLQNKHDLLRLKAGATYLL